MLKLLSCLNTETRNAHLTHIADDERLLIAVEAELGLRTFAVVGAVRASHGSIPVRDLAEHAVGALENEEWVRLGFYDSWYPESVDFFPRKLAHGDALRSMTILTGWVGAGYRYPACLIISNDLGEPEALLIFTSDLRMSDPDHDD